MLNGLGQLDVLKPFIGNKETLLFLDNDKSADKKIAEMSDMNIVDMRCEYSFFNDINDYLISLGG